MKIILKIAIEKLSKNEDENKGLMEIFKIVAE